MNRFENALIPAAILIFASCAIAQSASANSPGNQETEYKVETYSQDGRTVGCQLSFLVSASVDNGQAVYATAGDLAHYEYEGKEWNALRIKATVNVVRPSTGLQRIPLAMGWLDNAGPNIAKDTLSYLPLSSGDEAAPMWKHYIWNYDHSAGTNTMDPGLTQLMNAAHNGFTLLVRTMDTPLDEPIAMPPAPMDVQTRLLNCLDKQGRDAVAAKAARQAKP